MDDLTNNNDQRAKDRSDRGYVDEAALAEFSARLDIATKDPKSRYGNIHDVMFHELAQFKWFVVAFIRTYYPDWDRYLDLDALTFAPNELYVRDSKKLVPDVVLKIPFRDSEEESVELSMIAEHKAQDSREDNSRTILNLYDYTIAQTRRDWDAADHKTVLQTVALLVYTGDNARYDAPKWSDYFPLRPPFEEAALRSKVYCVNLTKFFSEGFFEPKYPMIMAAQKIFAMVALKRLDPAHDDEIVDALKLVENELFGEEKDVFHKFMLYLLRAASNDGKEISDERYGKYMDALNDSALTGGFENVFGFYNNSYFIKGRATGWDEGREEERKDSKKILVGQIGKALTRNFGFVPQLLMEKVNTICDVHFLDEILDDVNDKVALETIEKRIDKALDV